jgi:hypothetical protein
MTPLTAATDRVRHAHDLASVLDTAYHAFEVILWVISDGEDTTSRLIVPLLLAATQAANGRDAILFAPSLPPPGVTMPEQGGQELRPMPAGEVTAPLADLSLLLATRLSQTATSATTPGDRSACQNAAHHAHQIHDLLTSDGPP